MEKRIWQIGLAVVGILVLSGCATWNKNDGLLNQGLRNKVLALETQLSEKDNEINNLRETLARNEQPASSTVMSTGEIKQRMDVKQIQTALKNAGYFQGSIDGKMGKLTRQAVREFQRANNLPTDGKVGKKTTLVLKEYLNKKVK